MKCKIMHERGPKQTHGPGDIGCRNWDCRKDERTPAPSRYGFTSQLWR